VRRDLEAIAHHFTDAHGPIGRQQLLGVGEAEQRLLMVYGALISNQLRHGVERHPHQPIHWLPLLQLNEGLERWLESVGSVRQTARTLQ
jgi:hypothetical protein